MRRVAALAWLVGCDAYDEGLLERDLSSRELAAESGDAATPFEPLAGKAGVGRGGSGADGSDNGGASRDATAGRAGGGHAAGAAGKAATGSGGMGAAVGGRSGEGGQSGGSAGSSACVASESVDCCPDDPDKRAPGACGCNIPDLDSDLDSVVDCKDEAPFGWQREIVLDGSQITETLTNFVVLVRITDEQLKGAVADNASDIYFAAADKSTLLDFEIESYAADSGALVAWVRVPSLSAGHDSAMYLGYGDGKASRSDAPGVWGGFRHVWHLGQDPSSGDGAVKDATGRSHGSARGGMSSAARVAAVAGHGLSFDGKDDAVSYVNDVTGSGPGTLSGWVDQAADSGDNGAAIISFGSGRSNQSRFLLAVAEQQRIKVGFYGNDKQPETVLPRGTWKYVAWVWTGKESTVYVDGAIVYGPAAHASANTAGAVGSIGGSTFGYDFFMTGQLDEVRVATDVRSAAWIATEFNNQRPGSTFIKMLGAPQAAPSH
ncbi:MAG TPA: DUF2341 domain-containing protein [Polyangiales bacterium]|nr:DUF2341 domain-containing protein [Polyangiales bacterium]